MGNLREVELGATFAPFDSFQKLFGFVPNLIRAQTLLPRILEAEASIANAILLRDWALSRIQKEFILLAVATAFQNVYWVTVHYHKLQRTSGFGCPPVCTLVYSRDAYQAISVH